MTLSWRNLLCPFRRHGAARTYAQPPRTARPQLEALEDRLVPSGVNYNGGPVLQHVQVENLYYGQAWAPNQTNINQLDQFMKTITGSDYMSMLGEYGVGKGSFLGHDIVNNASSPAAGATLNEFQIQYMLSQEILNKHVPMKLAASCMSCTCRPMSFRKPTPITAGSATILAS